MRLCSLGSIKYHSRSRDGYSGLLNIIFVQIKIRVFPKLDGFELLRLPGQNPWMNEVSANLSILLVERTHLSCYKERRALPVVFDVVINSMLHQDFQWCHCIVFSCVMNNTLLLSKCPGTRVSCWIKKWMINGQNFEDKFLFQLKKRGKDLLGENLPPLLSKNCTISGWLLATAKWRGDRPHLSTWLTSAP